MDDLSAYQRFCCAFVRGQDGELLSCTGPFDRTVRRHWAETLTQLTRYPPQQCSPPADPGKEEGDPHPGQPSPRETLIKISAIHKDVLTVWESRERRTTGGIIYGVIFQQSSSVEPGFNGVFADLLLRGVRLFTSEHASTVDLTALDGTTGKIVDIFDKQLRYIADNDKWGSRGRQCFFQRVHEFVRRRVRVEFCLPAFPCKSSNLCKVSGVMPDRGEQLALENLHSFIEAVELVYEPGAKLWIVSDGHVFSDCIGVDDAVVDSYNTELIKMSAAISERRGGIDRIGFKSLVDMFDLGDLSADIPQIPGLPELERHIPTERTAAAEISRRMLLRIGRPEDKILRSRIISGDHGALKLYRGFSRFMAEDLSLNQHTRHLSRCKLKKLATKVAFEMIQRNEAYSNLVELFFPHHVRLSIHAHDNAGPKFGIKLLGPNVRAVEELSFVGAEMRSVDLLHVPTPWHNCLVEVRGHSTLIMTKSKVVRAALSDGSFSGGWVDVGDEDQSGHFRLQPAAFVKQCDEERDSPDMLDCCDAENPYLGGRGAVLDADMPYLYADMGFLYASLSGVFLH